MTQMGHGLPPLVGADTSNLDKRMKRIMPRYMTMGAQGMGSMGEMGMPVPPNSLPMKGAMGPFSYIDMGGCLVYSRFERIRIVLTLTAGMCTQLAPLPRGLIRQR